MAIYAGVSGEIHTIGDVYAGINGEITPLKRLYAGVNGVMEELFTAIRLEPIDEVIVGTGYDVDVSWGPSQGYDYTISISQDKDRGSGYVEAGYRIYGLYEGDYLESDTSISGRYTTVLFRDGDYEKELNQREFVHTKQGGTNYVDYIVQMNLGSSGPDWVAWFIYHLSVNGKTII